MQKFVILLIVVLLGLYTWLFIAETKETKDAEIAESVQISLQTSVSKGVATLNLPPKDIHPSNIINAARSGFPKGIKVDENLRMTILHSKREVQYKITDSGDLMIVALRNFTRFHIKEGRIVKNNHWSLPYFK